MSELLTPLEVYLSKSFEPDCEFIDGELVQRHVGDYYHSLLQSLLATHINNLRAQYGPRFRAFTEQRIQVGAQPPRMDRRSSTSHNFRSKLTRKSPGPNSNRRLHHR